MIWMKSKAFTLQKEAGLKKLHPIRVHLRMSSKRQHYSDRERPGTGSGDRSGVGVSLQKTAQRSVLGTMELLGILIVLLTVALCTYTCIKEHRIVHLEKRLLLLYGFFK